MENKCQRKKNVDVFANQLMNKNKNIEKWKNHMIDEKESKKKYRGFKEYLYSWLH